MIRALLAVLLFTLPVAAQTLPAFPGAMGGGTNTPGGRGGRIIEITTLADSGAGSYRACVTASGPRFCICRVSGVIPILSDIVAGSPFLTIDGQTCPGGGIILGDGKTTAGRALVIVTHDVVIRYLTYNPNNPSTPTGPSTGTVGLEVEAGATNVVLDHVSCFFAGNKCIISYTSDPVPISNVTQQWSLFTLPNVLHPVGPMTDTSSLAYQNVNQDFHHNLYAWIGHRIALYNTNNGRWVNNLTWNWCDPSAGYGFAMEPQGPSQIDIISNVWKQGNMNVGCSNPHPVNINATGSSDCTSNCWNGAKNPSDYLNGNVCAQGTDWACAAQVTSEGGPEVGTVPALWHRATPLPAEPNPIIVDPVTGLENKILATVGNSQGVDCVGNFFLRRNSVDAMVIAAWPNGNGYLFSQNVPQPTIAASTPCAEDAVTHVPSAYLAARKIPAGTNPWTVWPGDLYSVIETYGNGNSGVTPPPSNPNCFNNPSCSVGSSVAVIQGPANVRNAPSGNGQAMGTQPTGAVGIVASPPTNPGTDFAWLLVQFAGAPGCTLPTPTFSANCGYVGNDNLTPVNTPPPHPTVNCSPSTVPAGSTSQCTADQAVTWSASAGTISTSGLFTAPSTAQTVTVTGTNANGSGSVPVVVTAAPTTFQLNCTMGASNSVVCTGTIPKY